MKTIWSIVGITGTLIAFAGAILMHVHCLGQIYGVKMLVHTEWYDWVLFVVGTIAMMLGRYKFDRS